MVYREMAVAGLTSRLLAFSKRSTAAYKKQFAFARLQSSFTICPELESIVQTHEKRAPNTFPLENLHAMYMYKRVKGISPDNCQDLLAP